MHPFSRVLAPFPRALHLIPLLTAMLRAYSCAECPALAVGLRETAEATLRVQ